MPPVTATAAQRNILDHLKRHGPAGAAALAATLGVTPVAVRQHLAALEEAGLVVMDEARKHGARGRPTAEWRLTPLADAVFADTHAELSVELVANVREIFGEKGLAQLIEARTTQQAATYRAAMQGASTLKDRVRRLVRLRTDAGYMAEMKATADGFLLIENHCPICRAARACNALCRQEQDVFRTTLGPDVTVERTEHIISGARRCTYAIRQNKAS
jgi:predicted ArsR family transcriptional regulator